MLSSSLCSLNLTNYTGTWQQHYIKPYMQYPAVDNVVYDIIGRKKAFLLPISPLLSWYDYEMIFEK